MAVGDKSYFLNRETDWLNYGIIDNFCFDEDKMVLKSSNGKNGYFISFSFDSTEPETIWARMRMKAHIPENAIIRVSAYASDSLTAEININARDTRKIVIDDYIHDEAISLNERMHLLTKFSSTVYFDNFNDIPLYSLKGRYLWIAIEVLNYSFEKVYIESLKLDFPLMSFMEFLPEIYRRNSPPSSFLSRFVGLFQSIYTDIEEEILNIPELFDPLKVDREFLDWMTKWFSIRNSYIWSEEKLRKILTNVVKLYRIKGTKQAISHIVWMYTDCKAIIVEQFRVTDNEFYLNNEEYVKNLFGDNGYTFTVIIDSDKVNDSDEYVALLKLINLFKPAETKCNLVVLNNNIYLDYHCYLGINSYVSYNKQMVLNGNSVIMDSTFLSDDSE